MMGSKTDIKEMTTCGICNSSFSESAPKILPCLHTFCTNCVSKTGTESTLTVSLRVAPSTTFCCPYCKVRYAEAIIKKLPLNFSVACLVQILSRKPSTCQSCEDTDSFTNALCYDCPCFLCDDCMKSHARQKKDHKVRLLSEINDLNVCPPVLPIYKSCLDHSKPMKFYCQVDETPICEECVNDRHKGHLHTPIVQVIQSKKHNFQKAIDDCKDKVDNLQQAVNKIKELRKHMLKRKEENMQTLDSFFKMIAKDILDKRRNEIKQKVVDDHASRDSILQKQEDSIDSLLSQFKGICTFAENMLQYSAPQDVVDFEHEIVKQSEKLGDNKNTIVLIPKAEEQKLIKFLNESKIIDSISYIGSGVDIKKCKIIGPKSTKSLVGEKVLFSVILYPLCDGYMLDLKSLTAEVHYFNNDDDTAATEKVTFKKIVKSNLSEDDRYEISYVPTKSGDHMVSVMVEGQHIPRSPFQVTTWLRNYTEIEDRKCQVIKRSTPQHFTAPIGITIGPDNKIFILDYTSPKIIVFKQDTGDLTKERTIALKGEGEIKKPIGIALGNNRIAVSDQSSNSIKLFSFQGVYESKIGTPSTGNKEGQFNCPNGLAFNSKGILYATDYYNYRVQAFDINHRNKCCGKFGSRGTYPGQFKGYPGYIAVDKNDRVYVTDYTGSSINVYDANESHDFLCKIKCEAAWAIAVTPDDCLLVSSNEFAGDALNVFSPSHQIGYSRQLITRFGSRGGDKGHFRQIYGIAISKDGTIYVVEYGNKRIQVIYT